MSMQDLWTLRKKPQGRKPLEKWKGKQGRREAWIGIRDREIRFDLNKRAIAEDILSV